MAEALAYCRTSGVRKASLVIPFALSESERLEVLGAAEVGSLLIAVEKPGVAPKPLRLGRLLASAPPPVVFVGSRFLLGAASLWALLLRGRWTLICRFGHGWTRASLAQLIRLLARDTFLAWLHQHGEGRFRGRLAAVARRTLPLRRLWYRLSREVPAVATGFSAVDEEPLFEEVVQRAAGVSVADSVAGRIVHVNAGLAAGGAERQLCLTMTGLQAAGMTSQQLIGERLQAPSMRFMMSELASAGIRVTAPSPGAMARRRVLASLDPDLAAAIADLPPPLVADIMALVGVLRRERPQVVHAWQDASSVRAGLAAAITGTPRIVLSTRNQAPLGLPTYSPVLRPTYRALLRDPRVVMVNNSQTGAVSYANWLGVDGSALRVVRNAVDTKRFSPLTGADRAVMRRQLGIDESSPLVGGVFRMVEQKRPHLWIETAAAVARRHPEVRFVLLGDGPLAGETERLARCSLPQDRFYFLGMRRDVARVMGCFDLMLLVSRQEGLANVLLESQALEVPVVCTDVGGNREAVEDGLGGWICGEDTAVALATLVAEALADTDRLARVSRAARRFVAESFSPERLIRETVSLYDIAPEHSAAPGVTRELS